MKMKPWRACMKKNVIVLWSLCLKLVIKLVRYIKIRAGNLNPKPD